MATQTPFRPSLKRVLRAFSRAPSRGVTLIEVLIVVAILSLIAATVTVGVLPKFREAQIKTTDGNAREIRNAVNRWRGAKGGTDCPTISQLVQDKEIDTASKIDDAWGSAYKITCTEDEVIVVSPGPDKKEGTADDISVPKGVVHLRMVRAPRVRRGELRLAAGRGLTLIELLVVVALAAVMMTAVVSGMGAATNAKLKASTTLVASAVRTAYTKSSATAKPMRIVFDLDQSRIWLEESTGTVLVTTEDLASRSGGADPATEAEKLAVEQADKVLKGPRAPRPAFAPVKKSGFDAEDGKQGKELPSGIKFKEVHSMHQPEPATEGRSYLYVWPGGQTELAYLQLRKAGTTDEGNIMTVFIHPLTGRVKVERGAKRLPMLLGPDQVGEREDKLF